MHSSNSQSEHVDQHIFTSVSVNEGSISDQVAMTVIVLKVERQKKWVVTALFVYTAFK